MVKLLSRKKFVVNLQRQCKIFFLILAQFLLQLSLSKPNLLHKDHKELSAGVLQKNVFLKILENSQDKTCVGVSFLRKFQVSPLQLC